MKIQVFTISERALYEAIQAALEERREQVIMDSPLSACACTQDILDALDNTLIESIMDKVSIQSLKSWEAHK